MNLYLMPDAPETLEDLRKRAETAESIARALDAECETLRRMLKEARAGTWVPDMDGLKIWWVDCQLYAKDNRISITEGGVTVDFLLPDGYALCCKVTP